MMKKISLSTATLSINYLLLSVTMLTTFFLPASSSSQLRRSLIVGGRDADNDNTFPAFAWSGITTQGWGCGGALIHEDIILTAAHCRWAFYDTMSVMIGSHTIDNNDNVGEVIDIDKFAIHPMNDPDGYVNDIMLMSLRSSSKALPFKINRDPTYPKPMVDAMSVMGYGKTNENGTYSDTLQVVDGIVAFPSKSCSENWPLATNETFLCAGSVQGGKDACDDSGSPFIIDNNTVVAISGEGIGCGRPNIPSVNQRVSAFVDWIDENICLLSNNPPSKCRTIKADFLETSLEKKNDVTTETTMATTNSSSINVTDPYLAHNFTDTYDSYFDEKDDDSFNMTTVTTSTGKITDFKPSILEIFSILAVLVGAIVLAYRYCQRIRKKESYEKI